MKCYIKKRLIGFIIVLIGVSILSFLLVAFSGNDPAEIIARRGNMGATKENIEEIRTKMGLDLPLPLQYTHWLKGVFTGDPGTSIYSCRSIAEDLKEYLPTTLTLTILSLLWIVVLSVPIALLSARFRNSIFDHVIRGVSIFGICLPSFWLGFIFLLFFAVKLQWFSVLPKEGIQGYILPSLALAIPVVSAMVRLFRASLLTELSSDYVLYAKARGFSFFTILTHHVFRNALPPIVTVFCQYLGYLIAGTAVVESVFSLKGLGSYIVACVIAADARAVATCILIITSVFVIANLMGDIVNRLLCPWMVGDGGD